MKALALLLFLLAARASATTNDAGPGGSVVVKGTQGTSALAVQEFKDAGRTLYFSTATALAGVTTEALFNMSFCRDGVCSVNATTGAVTSGKKLRLTGMCLTWRNNTAAAGGVTVRCRLNPTGAVAATSPIFATLNATTSLATIGSGVTACTGISDEIELSGTMQWGCTQLAVGAVVGFDFNVIGFEY